MNCAASVKKQGLNQDNESSNLNSYINTDDYLRQTNPIAREHDLGNVKFRKKFT